jgi:LPXTG-motif cell wall-anchored protein
VEKVWKDGDNQDGIRPKEVTIHLLADGNDTGKSVTLNADNNWKASFDDLAVYNSGNEIAYTVTEDEVNGYTPEVSGTAKDGYTVTNIHTPKKNGNPSDPADHNGKKPTAPTDTGKGSVSNGTGTGTETGTGTGTETASQPNTGDTNAFAGYAGLLAAALAAGTGSLIWYRKKRKISK